MMGILLVGGSLIFLAAIPVLGVITLRTESPRSATLFESINRSVFSTWALLALLVTPGLSRSLVEFGVELSALTKACLWLLHIAGLHPWTHTFYFASLLIMQLIGFAQFIRGNDRERHTAKILSAAVTFGTFSVAAFIFISFALPLVKLLNDLSTIVLPGFSGV